MDEETKKLLRRNLEISEETFKIVKKMHRAQSISRFVTVFKWLAIAALAFGMYYYIQPYISTLIDTLLDIKKTTTDLPPSMLENIQKVLGQ